MRYFAEKKGVEEKIKKKAKKLISKVLTRRVESDIITESQARELSERVKRKKVEKNF